MYEDVEEKEVTVTLEDEKDPEVEVEKEPEKEQVEAQDSELTYSNIVDEDELDDYGKSVQKRIKKLTQKVRYAERDKDEAVRVAEVIKKENDTLQKQVTNLNAGFIDEYGARLESQEATAKQALREALDANDADKIFDAQKQYQKSLLNKNAIAWLMNSVNKMFHVKHQLLKHQHPPSLHDLTLKQRSGQSEMNGLVTIKL